MSTRRLQTENGRYSTNTMIKHCRDCQQDKPISEFAADRTRTDGYNFYCRPCMKKRKRLRDGEPRPRGRPRKDRSIIPIQVPRKECKIATVWKASPFEARELVWKAIEDGLDDIEAIRRRTKLTEDQVYDAIAELYSDGMLDRDALRQRIYKVAA